MNRIRKSVIGAGVIAGLAAATSCSRPEQPSPIVTKAEAAGAGDLSAASEASMTQWLAKHPEIARDIEGMCKPVRSASSATWSDTTEGKLCKASGRIAFYAPSLTTGDDRKFGAGNH